jgi:CubicO group peptidase (beta-lactamase class C family)
MVCPWFSMTKIVTATAAMRLAERGALDLDEPIGPHIPQFGRPRPSPTAERMKAGQMPAEAKVPDQHRATRAKPPPACAGDFPLPRVTRAVARCQ